MRSFSHAPSQYAKSTSLTREEALSRLSEEQEEEDRRLDNAASREHEESTPSETPWYLQIDTPTPPDPTTSQILNPLLERQRIPEPPEDAPAVLAPVLEYLSVDAGLDYLKIVDLRGLDPPPALGANLLMIIATARSVKHLNVCADRFCRMLRTRYKLRPYADGLLGRQELKVKLRRKAKRQKLARSVGNTMDDNKDDGITTGWICVNVGSVDEAVLSNEATLVPDHHTDEGNHVEEVNDNEQDAEEPNNDGYTGFGVRSAAPRIVVQMFTEEKRQEVDLEGLWDFRLNRRADKEERRQHEAEEIFAKIGESTDHPSFSPATSVNLTNIPNEIRAG